MNTPESEQQKLLSVASVQSIKSRTETGQAICQDRKMSALQLSLFYHFISVDRGGPSEDTMGPLKWFLIFMCLWVKGMMLSLLHIQL